MLAEITVTLDEATFEAVERMSARYRIPVERLLDSILTWEVRDSRDLPDRDGREFRRWLRSQGKPTPAEGPALGTVAG